MGQYEISIGNVFDYFTPDGCTTFINEMCHNMSKYNIFRILVSCLALLIVFQRFYYSICLGGVGGLQHPMWSLLRASMVLLIVREHLYFSKSFVTLTFKNFIAKSFFYPNT